jgi:hypothetical protein
MEELTLFIIKQLSSAKEPVLIALAAFLLATSIWMRCMRQDILDRLERLEKRNRELKDAVNKIREIHILKYPGDRKELDIVNGDNE